MRPPVHADIHARCASGQHAAPASQDQLEARHFAVYSPATTTEVLALAAMRNRELDIVVELVPSLW
jgi:hypothetical protein